MTQELHGVISLGGTVIGGSLYQRGEKGETGVGIESVVMTEDYDLVITYTDGDVVTLDTGLDALPDIVDDWLETHPEATTTVQDNSLTTVKYKNRSVTKEKLAEFIENAIYSTPVNVLLLGFDNTGTNDVSALFTQYSALYSLYFPAGKYRIDNTVEVKHSVYGAGYIRRPTQTGNDGTWFISNVSSGNLLHVTEDSVQLNKFCIYACDAEYCIDLDVRSDRPVIINEVGVFNVGGRGIMVEKPTNNRFSSRAIFINNVTIWGEPNYKSSIGIYLDGDVGDNRISDLEIMGTRYGLTLIGGITYGSDWHIWTGCLAGNDNGSWWANTRGVDMPWGGTLVVSNIYLDTCRVGLQTNDGANHDRRAHVCFNNLIWIDNDESIGGTNATSVFQYAPNGEPRIIINGGYFRVREASTSKASVIYDEVVVADNVVLRNEQSISSANKNLGFVGKQVDKPIRYKKRFTARSDTNTYNVIAKCFAFYNNGCCKFRFGGIASPEVYDVTVTRSNGTFSVSTNAPNTVDLYYKVENGFCYIYRGWGMATENVSMYVTGQYQRALFLYDYATNDPANPDAIDVQLTDTTGLTRIQNPQ